MNKKEVFLKITQPHKWYIDYCSQSYATQIKQRFAMGILGEKAIERLFSHFGYQIKTEEKWHQVQ